MQASDKAALPKTATATVIINIVRNQNAPIFTQQLYTAAVSDYWATGRELFVATAVDDDRQVDLSRNVSVFGKAINTFLVLQEKPSPFSQP